MPSVGQSSGRTNGRTIAGSLVLMRARPTVARRRAPEGDDAGSEVDLEILDAQARVARSVRAPQDGPHPLHELVVHERLAVVGFVRADSLLVPAAGKDRRRRHQEDARVYLTDSWVV
jgi:hypothetical protein